MMGELFLAFQSLPENKINQSTNQSINQMYVISLRDKTAQRQEPKKMWMGFG